ncbi:hypothetical protein [Yinghuangia soli]|uniref:Uncharacterized protein n=1 Tax=Yinghuangia soli TaxID=2908204 RepID=A0AA41Q8U4_9ACTN|nr:hypothetical protein [Yinghuangia soli]MCF2533351.1 hypothetical protein [Yinghuangia soli]
MEANITANYPAGTPVARLYRAEWQRAGLSTTAKIGLYACMVTHLQNAHAGAAAFPAGLALPALLDTNAKNEVVAWMKVNNLPIVVTAFSKDLVRTMLPALAPRVIDPKWVARAQ